MRIVSLLPSSTEIVCALGAGEELVGVSHECDFPESIRGRRVLTSARISTDASSLAIDGSVRSVVRDALSIYTIDEKGLEAARPDVVITQDLCEVCAVSLDDVRRAVSRLAHHGDVEIVSLRPTRLADIFDDLDRVGRAIGRNEESRVVRKSLEERVARIAARSAGVSRPRVASIEWIEPLMLGGTWMHELIELAGGFACGVTAGAPAPTIAPSDLQSMRPDVVVLKPCGFTIERSLQELEAIQRMVLDQLAPESPVWLTDGNAFFNRPGPRIVESLEIMAACVHPDLFAELVAQHAHSMRRLA